MFMFDESRIQAFCDDLVAGEWARVGDFLTDLLDKTPCETLDGVNVGGYAPLSMWVNAMLCSGMYKASDKGRYFFMKLVREIWGASSVHDRWNLLCSVACLYKKIPQDLSSDESRVEYFNELADMMQVSRRELMHAVIQHKSNNAPSVHGNHVLQ